MVGVVFVVAVVVVVAVSIGVVVGVVVWGAVSVVVGVSVVGYGECRKMKTGTRAEVAKEARAILRRLQDADGGEVDPYQAGILNAAIFDAYAELDQYRRESMRLGPVIDSLRKKVEQLTAQVVSEEQRRVDSARAQSDAENTLREIRELLSRKQATEA